MRTLAYGLLASTLLACDTEPTKQQSPDAPIEDVVEDTDVTPGEGEGEGEGEVDPGEGEGEGEIPELSAEIAAARECLANIQTEGRPPFVVNRQTPSINLLETTNPGINEACDDRGTEVGVEVTGNNIDILAFMGSDVLASDYRAFVFNFELVEHDGNPDIYMYKFNKELPTTAMTVLETGLGPDDVGYYVADDYTSSLVKINLEADGGNFPQVLMMTDSECTGYVWTYILDGCVGGDYEADPSIYIYPEGSEPHARVFSRYESYPYWLAQWDENHEDRVMWEDSF